MDRPPLSDHLDKAKADWLLFERTVVVEVKEVVDDREKLVQAFVDRLRTEPDWPSVPVESDLQDVLRRHPRGEKLKREFFDTVTSSINGAFEHANRQLRETKLSLKIPNAQTLLVFVNDAVDLLEPGVFVEKISQLFAKRTPDGALRYRDIDGVLVFTLAHRMQCADGRVRTVVFSIVPPSPQPFDPESSLEGRLITEWAAFTQQPLEDGGRFESAADLTKLHFIGRRPPLVL